MTIRVFQDEVCGTWHAHVEMEDARYHITAFSLMRLFNSIRQNLFTFDETKAEAQLKGSEKSEWDVPFSHVHVTEVA